MRIAILLRGFIERTKAANMGFKYGFKYDKTNKSFRESIIESMNVMGIEYDIYASIKKESDNDVDEFIKMYGVKEWILNEKTTQYDDILTGLNMIRKSGIQYDQILITRVDFIYKRKFEEIVYNGDKFNFCWMEPIGNNWICDNFYIFPNKFLDKVIEIYENNRGKFGERYFGQCIISMEIIKNIEYNFMFNSRYYSGTNWNNEYCNNPLYIIYGYDYAFGKIY